MTTTFLYDFISKYKYAVLSTVTVDNFPESAYVGFAVTRDLKIIFDTVSTSRKYLNLNNNPSISFVIGWDNYQTIQYEGTAKIPTTTELDDLLQTYFNVFPDGIERKENWKDLVYFCVEPKWIRYSDFNIPQKIEEKTF
ncbi:MAG TPA: pyridoxamine 5'-phosphate oxidase family protein [Chitinophagaceae bacterium]|jgi:general stress protein 26